MPIYKKRDVFCLTFGARNVKIIKIFGEIIMINLIAPENGEVLCLQTQLQRKFVEAVGARNCYDRGDSTPWAKQQERYDILLEDIDYSRPLPVKMSWSDDANRSFFTVSVSKNPDMSDAKNRLVKGNEIDFYNLETGVKYYWQVKCGDDVSLVYSFNTELTTPRTLFVNGVVNVRDIGGYKVDGGRVRQGLLYRGGCFEDLVDKSREITPEGVEELKLLGIKTDVDFRCEADQERQLTWELTKNAGFRRIGITAGEYGEIFEKEELKESQIRFFLLLADETAYPIYFHCWAGADRTGTFAFLIGSIIGMDKEDMICDYEFTSLSPHGVRTSRGKGWKRIMSGLEEYEGENIQSKAVNYLRKYLGISDDVLNKIREILIEKI